jgi:steroid 5-alpha reductase family enzyme
LARSYLQIFILQGLIISLVLLPFTVSLSSTSNSSSWVFFALILWIIGFCFEAIGDKQLDRFIKSDDPHKGTIMKTGLWKYTRHPNYFGESTMWWSLAIIALSSGVSFIVLLSPILITYLLLFVSGIPMLEKKWEGNEEWEAYKKKTSAFFPLAPKK